MNRTEDGFVRDPRNPGAIVSTNSGALESYKRKKAKNNEVDQLKSEVKEIKGLLHQLLERLNK